MNIQDIRKLQSFSNKNELDLRVRAFLYHHKAELSPGTRAVLQFIWRHSVKYPGVSFAKVETIQKETVRSRSTVIRAINTLEEKGLLTRIPNTRPNGKRGVNILVIRSQGEEKLPKVKDENTEDIEKTDVQPVETSENSDVKSTPKAPEAHTNPTMDTEYLPSYIPKAFIALTQSYLNVHDILTAWKSVGRAYHNTKLTYPVDHYIEVINRTFKQAVFAKQNGLIKKTFLGYFYGGMLATFTQLVQKEVMEDPSSLYYDWLNE